MRILPMGPLAVLADELSVAPAALAVAIERAAVPGVVDIVPAASTVLITVDDATRLDAVRVAVGRVAETDATPGSTVAVDIAVTYDGDDLAEVARRVGLGVDELVHLHAGAEYRVAFCGFAPGFAYLDGLPPELHLPRRSTPRTRVPAGAVAIAAGYSAVYPTSSPGGWHLLGRTDDILFDLDAHPPARLTPGKKVRFIAT